MGSDSIFYVNLLSKLIVSQILEDHLRGNFAR